MASRWRAGLGGDLAGGVTAAILTIPVNMGFGALVREHHAVAIKILTSLARELSTRLRRTNQTIYELEA